VVRSIYGQHIFFLHLFFPLTPKIIEGNMMGLLLADYVIDWEIVKPILHAALLTAFFGVPAGIFIWAERKVSARIQDRLGPTRTGGRFGWLQSAADGLKLIQKEDLAPKAADQFLFKIAPYIVVSASLAAFMFLPFSDGWAAVSLDVGLFALFAILSLEVIGVILAGYSSGSKWALFGAIREAAQMVSYEIPLAICGLIPIVMVGTLNLNEIILAQSGSFWNWTVFNPICGIAFVLFFTCATASCKRAPFDLAEAESELVAGFLTEYSGMRWSFFFLAEYATMYLVSAVAAILFLGGWSDGLGIVDGIKGSAVVGIGLSEFLGNCVGLAVLGLKASLLVFLQIWVRWTLPRLRIDQVITTCFKYLIPMSCALFMAAVLYPLIMSAPNKNGDGRPQFTRTSPLGTRLVSKQLEKSRRLATEVASAEGSDE
jgi:NADH-quinone oxidoreductase subunit H